MRVTTRALDDFTVDNTMLKNMAHCTTLAVVENLLGLRASAEVAPLKSGSDAHTALAHWHETQGEDVAGALRLFERDYRPWSTANLPASDRLSWQNLSIVLQSWFRKHPFGELPYTVEAIEVGFRAPLAPTIDFVGLLDIIGRAKSDGSLRVTEHKTTGGVTPWWKEQWKWSSQLTGYLYGAGHVLKETVVAAYVNAVEFKLIPKSDRTCKDHGTAYAECGPLHCNHEILSVQRQRWQFERWQASAVGLAKKLQRLAGIINDMVEADGESAEDDARPNDALVPWESIKDVVADLPQEGTFTGQCRFCSLKDFCGSNRRHRSLLVHHPWNPEERVTLTRAT